MWSSMSKLTRVALLALAVASAASLTLSAHHGWAGYSNKEFDITGTVTTALSLGGAHATMKITADGQVWNLTLAPPARTKAAGLEATTIPVGATVTAHGHRHANAKIFEVKTERITYNGKTYNVYPDRT